MFVYPSALETTPTSATICLIYHKTSKHKREREREIDSQLMKKTYEMEMQKKDTSLNRRPSNLRPSGFTYSILVDSKYQLWESNEKQRLTEFDTRTNKIWKEARGEREEEETRLTFAKNSRRRDDGGLWTAAIRDTSDKRVKPKFRALGLFVLSELVEIVRAQR